MKTEKIKAAAEHMSKALALLASGPLDYYLTEMTGAHDYMMERFCPFKVGDRVELTKTPVINQREAPGWQGAKHFLVEGAVGVIESAECGSRGFCFGVVFDAESYIDFQGKEHPANEKHAFHFREASLRAAATQIAEGE